jgi:hypothetical protein
MSMQHRLSDQVVPADAWTLFCAECSQKMRILTAFPAQRGRETRTYECACGHSERIDVALHLRTPRGSRPPKHDTSRFPKLVRQSRGASHDRHLSVGRRSPYVCSECGHSRTYGVAGDES